jgi:PTH1 family peptidyl-tRNA hydrolase
MQISQIIVGLGNPGEQYRHTRHNAGWLALDHMVESGSFVKLSEVKKFDSVMWEVQDGRTDEGVSAGKILFVYPHTFMNSSGDAVAAIVAYYKLSPADVLVIHDDVDLPLGTTKFTAGSGAAGHNGVQSIIDALHTQDFRRIRIGVETRESRDVLPTDAFVLQPFTPDELKQLPLDAVAARVVMELRPKV